jgi:hypothetical protein
MITTDISNSSIYLAELCAATYQFITTASEFFMLGQAAVSQELTQ